ncbi:MAG: ATPase central domain protein [Acidimicrobiia bacterium]|nr:ATPase central domain protein [Acidimicrobiia bacterium]
MTLTDVRATEDMSEPLDPSLRHLRARLAVVEARVSALVAWRRSDDPDPDDPYRGVYVAEAHVDRMLAPSVVPARLLADVDRLLAAVEAEGDRAEGDGSELRLRSFSRRFGLSGLEIEALLIALAPDLDPRFEKLYGYLHDDLTRRRASPSLVLELTGTSAFDMAGRAAFLSSSPLLRHGVISLDATDRPLLTRSMRVADRVVDHLLGSDKAELAVARLVPRTVVRPSPEADGYGRVLGRGGHLYVRDGALAVGAAAAELAGKAALAIDLNLLRADDDATAILDAIVLEARLRDLTVVAGPVEILVERQAWAALARLADDDRPSVLVGAGPWDGRWSMVPRLVVDAEASSGADRAQLWRDAGAGDLSDHTALAAFKVTPDQADRAVETARYNAIRHERPVQVVDVMRGARNLNTTGLERLARRVVPAITFADLVLPPSVAILVAEIELRARRRTEVSARFGLGTGRADGKGVTALLSGPPGTGKTMAAEAVAGALGFDLYVVDLATVVDKYIGETEKHLDRVFREAEGVNGVLFFDEADALFGKRSEVSDAKDRYANLEIAYLLQRMETFEGVTVLATNMGANLDEAFVRRLDVVAELPAPDAEARRQLWDRALGRRLPRADDVDLDLLADRYELSGGHIRNVGLLAAFLATEDGGPVTMTHLLTALGREMRKSGRLFLPPT